MSPLALGTLAFVIVFSGALFGMILGRILPKEHLQADARDVIKVSMAMVATLTALVLGLLTASSKSSFDDKETELISIAASIVHLDRTLAEYGAEGSGARDLLKRIVAERINAVWPEETAEVVEGALGRGTGFEPLQKELLALEPRTDAQRWLQSTALQISNDIAAARWSLTEQTGSRAQWPFLVVVVFWIAIIFVSFGLFAPRNGTVVAALFIAGLSVAGSIYLILEMDQPYGGAIKIASTPLRTALEQLGQP